MKEKLITLREVSENLGILEKEVIDLAHKKKIPSYLIGGEFLRFPREEIYQLKTKIQKEYNILVQSPSIRESLFTFLYFNDFYILSSLIMIVLLGIIIFT